MNQLEIFAQTVGNDIQQMQALIAAQAERLAKLEAPSLNWIANADNVKLEYTSSGARTLYIPRSDKLTSDIVTGARCIVCSCDVELENAIYDSSIGTNRIGIEIRLVLKNGTNKYIGAWLTINEGYNTNFNGQLSYHAQLASTELIDRMGDIYLQIRHGGADKCLITNPKVERLDFGDFSV